MADQANHGIAWTKNTLQRQCLRPGDSLVLSRQHSKEDENVELKFWWQPQDLKDWDPSKISASGAPSVVITLGNRKDPGGRYSGPDSTLKTDQGSKPLTDAVTRPGPLALQLSVFNADKSLLPNDVVWLPCPVTPHDKRMGAVVKVFVAGKEQKLVRKFELLTRQLTWRQKMEAFLKWQDKLVYGPPTAVRYDKGRFYSKLHWDGGGRIYHASASGKRESCYVCSPFANAFMVYWWNYHDVRAKAVSLAGQSMELLFAAYPEFFEGGAALPRGEAPAFESMSIAALNALAPADRVGRYFRLSDDGDLAQGVAKAKGKKPNVKAFKKDEQVSWAAKKSKWSTISKLPTAIEWTFSDLYDVMSKDEAGTVYVCASSGHVWLMVVLGGAYTVEKSCVLGGGGDCEPGVYRLHASPAVPLEFGFTQYLKPEYVEKKKIKLKGRTKAIDDLNASLKAIADNKELASSETALPYSLIYANLKADLEKVMADDSFDGLFAFGGTDLTMCNAKLSKADNGSIKFNRGEAAPEPYRIGTASSDTFKVWKLKRLIDDQTGWLKADHPAVGADEFLKSLVLHDCRPIDSA